MRQVRVFHVTSVLLMVSEIVVSYKSSDGARQQECSAILSIDRCEQRADLFIDFFRARHGVRDIRPQQFAKAPP